MRIEQLYNFIVPLMFLAIWALTSLFSREAQQIPPRAARPQGPSGPRPASAPLQTWRSETLSREVNPQRPVAPGASKPPPKPVLRPEEGIVILEPERTPQRTQSNRTQGVNRRLPAKLRKSTPPPRPPEPAPQRTLGGSLASTMTSSMEPSQSLTKLSLGAVTGPLHGTTHDLTLVTQAAVSRPVDRAGPTAQELRDLLKSPEKVLQMMLLKELLGPPVALRGRPGRQW